MKSHEEAEGCDCGSPYGLSADLDPILEVCREYDVSIEDVMGEPGAYYKGKQQVPLATWGSIRLTG